MLAPGGRLLLIVPHEWEVHQAPHDYYRYTRYGIAYLLEKAGFREYTIEPVDGYFCLCSRRLFERIAIFPRGLVFRGGDFSAPPCWRCWFDSLDRERNFTLGYIC